jgi:hypothetical protein
MGLALLASQLALSSLTLFALDVTSEPLEALLSITPGRNKIGLKSNFQ